MRRLSSVFLFTLLVSLPSWAGVYPGTGRFTGRWCVGGRGGGCFATKERALRRFREINHRNAGGSHYGGGGGFAGPSVSYAFGYDPDRIAVAFVDQIGSASMYTAIAKPVDANAPKPSEARVTAPPDAGASPSVVAPSFTLEDAPVSICDDLESVLGAYRDSVNDMRDTAKRQKTSGFSVAVATEEHKKIGSDIDALDGSAEALDGKTVLSDELVLKGEIVRKIRDLSGVLRRFYDDVESAVEAGDADGLKSVVSRFDTEAERAAPALLKWADGVPKRNCKSQPKVDR